MMRWFVLSLLLGQAWPASAQQAIPSWAVGAVWYRIVPERFRNANPRNDPVKERVVGDRLQDWQVHPWASDWYKFQVWEEARQQPFYDIVRDRRYGGDLVGVSERLRYLRDLGVDVVSFTPLFESRSVLKYDAASFHHIDNNFGQDREGDWSRLQAPQQADLQDWQPTSADDMFFEFVGYAHELGLKVVLDVVFSYCGRDFWAFRDVRENQQDSPYKDWFVVTTWDDPATPDTVEFDYAGWHGDKSRPLFRQDQAGPVQPVKDYLFASTRRWMDPNGDGDPLDGVDGWCLGASAGLKPAFWREWVALVKSINPNAVTVVAAWEPDAPRPQAPHFDLTDNPAYTRLVDAFFVYNRLSVTEFDAALKRLREDLGDTLAYSVLNWLDTHKTDRLASRIMNADRRRDGASDQADAYDPRKPNPDERALQKLIVFFHLAYVGAPTVFYGDESGLWGGPYPDNLKPMMWPEFTAEPETYASIRPDLSDYSENRFDRDLYRVYRGMGRVRRENVALRRGDFHTLLTDDARQIYAFLRKFEKNEVLVVLNKGEDRQQVQLASPWPEGTKVRDPLRKAKLEIKEAQLTLDLTRRSALVLVKNK